MRQPIPMRRRVTTPQLQLLIGVAGLVILLLLLTFHNHEPSHQLITAKHSSEISVDSFHLDQKLDLHSPAALLSALPKDIWAEGTNASSLLSKSLLGVGSLLDEGTKRELYQLCGRCIYHTLLKSVNVRFSHAGTFVATGDIPDQWIRDSSVQLSIYLPRIKRRPILRRIIETAIQRQAFYILADPWANSFRSSYRAREAFNKQDRQLGRGGWVATRNFELDSSAYFLNLLYNFYTTPDLYQPETLLADTLIHDAIMCVLDTWIIEQFHEQKSPYRYSELPRDGLGAPVGYTGMVWSGYRPSDDKQTYGYNIPDNMWAAGSLMRLLALNRIVWKDAIIDAKASKLYADMKSGIENYGVVSMGGVKVYAYEVDGLGGFTRDFDDPNMPGLLGLPLLGYPALDQGVYRATRERLLSPLNPYYFSGSVFQGLGSPHTPHGYVWPLGLMTQALTSTNQTEVAWVFRTLLKLQGNNGLMHESVSVNQAQQYTRPVFEWANAMLVVTVEQLLGMDCDASAEAEHTSRVWATESSQTVVAPNGGQDKVHYYSMLQADIAFAANI